MPRFSSGFPPARRSAARSRSSRRSSIISCTVPRRRTCNVFFAVTGGGGGLSGQNTGQAYVNLAPFDKRKRIDEQRRSRSSNALPAPSAAFATRRSSRSFPERSAVSARPAGFSMELQNTSGMSREQFAAARDRLLAAASSDPLLEQVRLSELPDVASLKVNVDQQRLAALGLDIVRRQLDAVDRLGRPLRQRLHRSRPSEARLCPGRCALPVRTVRHRQLVSSATTRARWCPSPPSRRRDGQSRR